MKKSARVSLVAVAVCVVSAFTACNVSEADYSYRGRLDDVLASVDGKGDLDSAQIILDSLLTEYPGNQDCRYMLARIMWCRGRNEEALSVLNDITRHYNRNNVVYRSTMHLQKGFVLRELGSDDKAVKEYRKAIKLAAHDNPDNVKGYMLDLADFLFDLNRIEESDEIYRGMLKDDSEDVRVMLGLAFNCLKRGDLDEGLKWTNKAVIIDCDNPDVHKMRMWIHYLRDEEKLAADDALRYVKFADADEVDIDDVTFFLCGNYEYALEKVWQKIEELENCGIWIAIYVRMCEYNDDYEAALDIYNQILEAEPDQDVIRSRAANCYYKLGRYADALREINTAMKTSSDIELIGRRADIYVAAGDYRAAISDFSSLTENNLATVTTYSRLGLCYEYIGRDDLSFESFQQGIFLFPGEDAGIYVLRGDCYMGNGDKTAAESDYQMALNIEDATEITGWSALALMGLGRSDDALQCINELIESAPQSPSNYYIRACMLCRMDRPDEALQSLRDALQHGFSSFATIENNPDLLPLRRNPEFRRLLDEYRARN